MKRKPAAIAPEDSALFREAIGDVRRIDAAPAAAERPPPTPEPRHLAADEADALRASRDISAAVDVGEALAYRRDEVPEKLLRRLRRGQFSVLDEIDLHRLRAADAEALLKRFLNDCRREGRLCVRVIHGKGLGAPSAPVLKALVDRVLRHRGDVLAFASAPASRGGTGAVLVLLARGNR